MEQSGLQRTLVAAGHGVDGAQLHLDTLLRRVDFWRLGSGGANTPGGVQEFGSGECTMTVLAQLCSLGSGTLVVGNDLFWHARPRSGTSSW